MSTLSHPWSSLRIAAGSAVQRVGNSRWGDRLALKELAGAWSSRNCAKEALAQLRRLKAQQPDRPLAGILLYEHFGDIVAAEPVAHYARTNFPTATIVWFTNPAYAELLSAHPEIDRVFPIQSITEAGKIARSGFLDHVIDLHLEGKPCRRFGRAHRKHAGDRRIDVENYYDFGSLLEALSRSAGLPRLDAQPRLYLSRAVAEKVQDLKLPKKYIVVHALSNESARNWSPEGWRELGSKLAKAGVPIVEIGLKSELKSLVNPVIDLCGQLTLPETAEVIRQATAFVGVDSGPAHLANAFQRPSVILLGRYRRFNRYMPYTGFLRDHAETMVIQWPEVSRAIPVREVLRRLDALGILSSDGRYAGVMIPAREDVPNEAPRRVAPEFL